MTRFQDRDGISGSTRGSFPFGRAMRILCLLSATNALPGQDELWTIEFGQIEVGDFYHIAVDSMWIYLAGRTYGALPGQVNLGESDASLCKLNTDGNVVWTRQFGTERVEQANCLTANPDGIYVGGSTGGALPGQVKVGYSDAFLRKYDQNGNEIWTRQFCIEGPDSDSSIESLSRYGSEIYVVGDVEVKVPGQNVYLPDAFVRKYSSNGSEVWTRQFHSEYFSENATSCASVPSGVYVAGETDKELPGQVHLGRTDGFLRKYDHAGNEIWTRQFGTAELDWVKSINCDASGIYICGFTFGAFPGQVERGTYDAYICKYDHAGNAVWTRQFGTDQLDWSLALTCHTSGTYVTGWTNGVLPGEVKLGQGDAFMCRYDPEGNVASMLQFGTNVSDVAESIVCDASGIYVGWQRTDVVDDRAFYSIRKYSVPELVSRWKFDGDTTDSQPAGNDGAFVGSAASYVTGYDGTARGALLLNGYDQYMYVRGGVGLPISVNDAYSFCLWVKGPSGQNRYVISESSSDTTTMNPAWGLFTNPSGTVSVYLRDDSSTECVCRREAERHVLDDTWHHLAWIDDGGRAALYIDGLRQTTDFSYVRSSYSPDTTTIGAILRESAVGLFNGAVDDVRIYKGALSVVEIRALVGGPPSCPGVGDTRCEALTIEGPGTTGDHVAVVHGAFDGSGDPIIYTFSAEDEEGNHLQVGPQGSAAAEFFLLPGTWTITATVDDDLKCTDAVPEAVRTALVTVLPEAKHTVAQWSFDGNLLDSSGNGNHGAMARGQAAVYVAGHDGKQNGAVQLDGIDDYIQVAQQSGLPISSHPFFTVALWVKGPKPTASVKDRSIFAEASDASNVPLFGMATDDQNRGGQEFPFLRGYLRDDADCHLLMGRFSKASVFDGSWHHVAWVDSFGDVTLYVDGEPDPTDFDYTRGALSVDTTALGGIQRAGAAYKGCFLGAIDDAHLYDYALTQAEVRVVMAGGEGGTHFMRGDANDDGTTDISDAVAILGKLFLGGYMNDCKDAADVNDDGTVDISDPVRLLGSLFLGAERLPEPRACGIDPTADELNCNEHSRCQF